MLLLQSAVAPSACSQHWVLSKVLSGQSLAELPVPDLFGLCVQHSLIAYCLLALKQGLSGDLGQVWFTGPTVLFPVTLCLTGCRTACMRRAWARHR